MRIRGLHKAGAYPVRAKVLAYAFDLIQPTLSDTVYGSKLGQPNLNDLFTQDSAFTVRLSNIGYQ